jgi:hypothetical protein
MQISSFGAPGYFSERKQQRPVSLLEIAPRIAGGSALTRNYGVNMRLTLSLFDGQINRSILLNNMKLD